LLSTKNIHFIWPVYKVFRQIAGLDHGEPCFPSSQLFTEPLRHGCPVDSG